MRRLAVLLVLLLLAAQDGGSGLKHEVLTPKKKKDKMPMIVLLHGTGGNWRCWRNWWPIALEKGWVIVLPVSTGSGDKAAGNSAGDNRKRWASIDTPKLAKLTREAQRKYQGDPKRTYIGGYSNGGFYAMEAALAYPNLFSAVLCIGGGCNVYPIPEEAKRLGAYIIHGTADPNTPFTAGEKSAKRLEQAGLTVVFKRKEGKGHLMFQEEAKEFFQWTAQFQRTFTPGTIDWPTDFDAAMKKAAEEKKLVWAYFYAEKDAKNLNAELIEFDLLGDRRITEFSKDYVLVKIDRDKSKVDEKHKIKRATLCIIEPSGKVRRKFNRKIEPEKFIEAVGKLKKPK
ncbi:MAG: alpha/beta hydrolase [Planctomycetota bacterium]|jgi:predicted esterase